MPEDEVRLRPWRDYDAVKLSNLFDDPLVYRFTPVQPPFEEKAAARRIDVLRRAEARRSSCARAVVVANVPVGEVAAYARDGTDNSGSDVSISYVIGAEFRGRRLARTAVELLIAELTEIWSVRRFVAEVSPENPASEKVAASLGFVQESDAEPRQRPGKEYSVIPWVLVTSSSTERTWSE